MILAVVHPSAMVSSEAVRAFWSALPIDRRPASPEALVPHVAQAWQRARAAHPQIAIDDVELMAFAGARIATADAGAELERRHVEDVYLACACARGDRAALAALEEGVMPVVMRGLGRIAATDDARRDVLQTLREQMLVAKDGAPGIARYDGRAPLAIWLRVCAARLGKRAAQKQERDEALDDERLDQLAPGVPDPQLAYLQQHYGAQFRAAFGEAVASLPPRERNLLRHAVIDGLSIDQIAAIYHVHRATAARQLNQTRTALVAATRERMRIALGVSESELDSIFRVLISMADVTLRGILHPIQPRKSDG
jgi:RNA polymerase sigma-70 factor, ECF subfamily